MTVPRARAFPGYAEPATLPPTSQLRPTRPQRCHSGHTAHDEGQGGLRPPQSDRGTSLRADAGRPRRRSATTARARYAQGEWTLQAFCHNVRKLRNSGSHPIPTQAFSQTARPPGAPGGLAPHPPALSGKANRATQPPRREQVNAPTTRALRGPDRPNQYRRGVLGVGAALAEAAPS